MNDTTNTLGEVRPDHTVTVRDRTALYSPVPDLEARANRIADDAGRWLTYASTRTRMTPAALTTKALQSACFSVATGASGFAVPSKLVGVRDHQARLWALVRDGYARHAELGLGTATTDGVSVTYDGDPVGQVQTKHVPWLRPLVPFGARLYLARVTGSERAGYLLGVNVVVGHVGEAVTRLLDATREATTSGDGSVSGDGQAGGALPVLSATDNAGSGDVDTMRRPLRLLTRDETGPEPSANPDDVVLYREIDGTARASVPHVPRHSPTGPEWGYCGSGPADLARSILLALVPDGDVDGLYQAFSAEVVARVPYAGGLIRAREVRWWAERQTDGL